MITLSSFIATHARLTPERTAIRYQGVDMTYRELSRSVSQIARLLYNHGLRPGQTVALLMKNSPAFLQFAFGASHIGAIFLPINFRLSASEVRYILSDAEARILVVDEEFEHLAEDFPGRIILDATAQANATCLIDEPVQDIADAPHPCAPTDLFRLMYTSGTTDRPKGVMHSYENFYWKSISHVQALGLNAQTRLLVVGPLYHVGAFDLPGIAVLWFGGMVSIHRDFDPGAVLDSIEAESLNAAWLAPVMTTALLTHPHAKDRDLSSLAWVIGGGERTPETRIRQFAELFPKARYIDAYGLTESCSGDTMMPAGFEISKIGSTGLPLMHVSLSIRNDDGREMAPNQEGEVCLRGPKVTKGYWKDEKKTQSAFHGSWFRTGDVGYVDEDGFLFLTDRKKDMIISGGENIASSEIERVLQMRPEIAEVAVIGMPDARWGERPVAIFVPTVGSEVDEEILRAHCRSHLAAFKIPSKFFACKSLPRNPSGKILKRELRESLQGGNGGKS